MQKLSIPTQYTRFVPSYPFLHVSFRSLSIGELCTLVTDTLDFVPRPWGSRGIGGNFHQTGECKSMELVVEEARFKWDWRFNWTVDKVCLGSQDSDSWRKRESVRTVLKEKYTKENFYLQSVKETLRSIIRFQVEIVLLLT